MRIFLGADHGGFKLKEAIKKYLQDLNLDFEDLGNNNLNLKDDYPDYAILVAKKVAKEKNSRGILVCGTGTGMVIAANKVKSIRAVAAYDGYSAKMSRNDNDANILCLRGRFFPIKKIKEIISIWLATPFSKKARHQRRIKKINSL